MRQLAGVSIRGAIGDPPPQRLAPAEQRRHDARAPVRRDEAKGPHGTPPRANGRDRCPLLSRFCLRCRLDRHRDAGSRDRSLPVSPARSSTAQRSRSRAPPWRCPLTSRLRSRGPPCRGLAARASRPGRAFPHRRARRRSSSWSGQSRRRAASLYGIGYGRHEPLRAGAAVLPGYLAGMNLVVLADDAFSFLLRGSSCR